MILRPGDGTLFFVTQPDHASLSADMVEHFQGFAARPRRDAIRLAVREHEIEGLTGHARGEGAPR